MSKFNLKGLIKESIDVLLKDIDSTKNILKIREKQINKIHFIPLQYRIFNGVLQSFNIKFGDFLQKCIGNIIAKSTDYEVLPFINDKIAKKVTNEQRKAIDQYLDDCENIQSFDRLKRLNRLLATGYPMGKIVLLKRRIDVDLAFRKGQDIFLLEMKYEDNHDTGKLPSIYRKLFTTYFALRTHFQDKYRIRPFLFYFSESKRWDSKYLIEGRHVLRGKQFWKKFTNIDFENVKKAFAEVANDREVLERFKHLKEKINNYPKTE